MNINVRVFHEHDNDERLSRIETVLRPVKLKALTDSLQAEDDKLAAAAANTPAAP